MSKTFYPTFKADELANNSSRAVETEGKNILICNADDEFYAIDNVCTHQKSPLEGGRIRNCHISCPLHGVRFNLADGVPKGQLTNVPVKTYETRVSEEGIIEIALD